MEGKGLLFAAQSFSRLRSLSDQWSPQALPSTLGSLLGSLVLTWLMTSTAPDPAGKKSDEKCGTSLLSSALPLFSRSFVCEARPGTLTGKISTGDGGSLLLPVVKATHTFLQSVSEAVL